VPGPPQLSELDKIRSLHERAGKPLSERQIETLKTDWTLTARPNQLPPASWGRKDGHNIWLLLAGRNFGKTRSATERIQTEVAKAEAEGRKIHVHLIGGTANDVFNVMLNNAKSGLAKIGPKHLRPRINGQRMTLEWPGGSTGAYFSSDAPSRLRGPECELFWADELATFQNIEEVWSNLMFGWRLGKHPRGIVTSTPNPPIPLLWSLSKLPTTAVVYGSSHDNRHNTSDDYYARNIAPYEGTRRGRAEIYGELLEELQGDLFKTGWFRNRVFDFTGDDGEKFLTSFFKRIVVSIDPAIKSHEAANETGIIVFGLGHDNHGYVLDDLSGRYTPDEWARKALAGYDKWHASKIVVEQNQGGDMCSHTLRVVRQNAPIKLIHASKGKVARAEPVSSLYEQGKIWHRAPDTEVPEYEGSRKVRFEDLESQLITYQAGEPSPDRMDALVWAVHETMLGGAPSARGMFQGSLGWF
jgi:phage terminase large subunit-like protein